MSERPHVMIIESRFYEDIADELVRGATAVFEESDVGFERFAVPGVFEIPAAIQMAVRTLAFSALRARFDAFLALGCVIRGETSHYDIVCEQSARALQDLAIKYTLALGFGILTVDTKEQAWVRASVDQRNKGAEAARASLQMIDLKRQLLLFPR